MGRATKITISFFAFFAFFASPLWASSKGGTSSATFLRLEQGARPIGMGGAYTAVANDANSLWWNPAGLGRAKNKEALVSHTQFIEKISTQYMGFVYPLPGKGGAMGASFTYLDIPGIEGYDANKNSTGKLKANSYAGSIAYGKELPAFAQVGVNLKLIAENLDTESATGMGADIGLQIKKRMFSLGLAAQNIGPSFKIANKSSSLPTSVRAGIGFNPLQQVTLAVDGESPTDGYFKPRLGAEWKVTPSLALRGGFQKLKDLGPSSSGLSLGLTFWKFWATEGSGPSGWESSSGPEGDLEETLSEGGGYLVSFDYAFVSYGDLSNTHRISMSIKF